MPSFSDLPEGEGFCFAAMAYGRRAFCFCLPDRRQTFGGPRPSLRQTLLSCAGLSIINPPRAFRGALKDQCMFIIRSFVPAVAGWLVASYACFGAVTVTEDFSSDPAAHGWKTFGNTNLFQWDKTNQNLRVTWDSTQSNSYFFLPVGTVLARDDDFSVSFDLNLTDASTGDTPAPMQLAVGFLNQGDATGPSFSRPFGVSPNVAEFDYYPFGYFGTIPSPATATPGFVDDTSSAFAPLYFNPYYDLELPNNQLMHVAFTFTASNQTALLQITTNGVPLAELPGLVLNNSTNSMFVDTNDFRLTMLAISSYSEAGQDPQYAGSVLAHGVIDNLVVSFPPPPVQGLAGMLSNGEWLVQFTDRTNWLYTLERTVDFASWSDVSPATPGQPGSLQLSDPTPPGDKAFYRVRASRP